MSSEQTSEINVVDFSKTHDPNDFLHYARKVNGVWQYESYEKSTKTVVYRGSESYWQRKDKAWYEDRLLRRRANYSSIMRQRREEEALEQEKESEVLRRKTDKA